MNSIVHSPWIDFAQPLFVVVGTWLLAFGLKSVRESSGFETSNPTPLAWRFWAGLVVLTMAAVPSVLQPFVPNVPSQKRINSSSAAENYQTDQTQKCMEASIYDSVPFQIGGPSESQIGSAPGEIEWFGYPYWMIITQAREKIHNFGPNSPIMNHRLLVAFMTRKDAEEFVKVIYPTGVVCGELTPRSDTYDVALVARSYRKRQWQTDALSQSLSR